MTTLQIDNTKARGLYKSASPEFKTMLEDTFGKDFFSQKITDRIKTFADASAEVNVSVNQNILLAYNGIDGDMVAARAYLKLTIIAKALNEGWSPDWTNSSQRKWYNWFENYKAGFGFSRSGTDFVNAYTIVGSRLCFKSEELARYAATQFIEIYNEFLNL